MWSKGGSSPESPGARSPAASPRWGSEGLWAVRLFSAGAGVLAIAWLIAWSLVRWFRPPGPRAVPAAFAISTLMLVLCSAALQGALTSVRRERRTAFRRSLVCALACGTAFVGVQAFGIHCLVESLRGNRNAGEAELGATALVLAAAALHALHVSVALMVLVYVTLGGLGDRYDHEYSFGVSVCAWFWHVLAALWILILGAYVIVLTFLTIRVPAP